MSETRKARRGMNLLNLDELEQIATAMTKVHVDTTPEGMVTLQQVASRLPVLIDELRTKRAMMKQFKTILDC